MAFSARHGEEVTPPDRDAFFEHLRRPSGIGHTPAHAHTGAAGGAACGDLIRVSLAIDEHDPHGRILDAGFDASGCGATLAAGSAAVTMLQRATLLDAARIGAGEIASELGGLIPGKLHAAELAADALHRALGAAARSASLRPAPGRTLVAMSGGVDSAVAALLSVRAGQQALGVTLELWADAQNDAERSCCSAAAVRSARSLAHRLGLPHLSIDLRAEFAAGVVQPWLQDHAAGLTPYACVRCNGSVRLDGMLELAERLGAETLVTGHYARIHREGPHMCGPHEPRMRGSSGRACAPRRRLACEPALDAGPGVEAPMHASPLLRVAVDEGKDQSYALAALRPRSLARLCFPLGSLRKGEVRAIAREAGLEVARKRDSQDLCFLAGTSAREFLTRHGGLSPRSGDVLDADGTPLGRHDGVDRFTIGQRRGLGIGGGQPRFVLATDAASNTVTVGAREQLLTSRIEVVDAVLRREGAFVDSAKIRYRGRRLPCAVAMAAAVAAGGEGSDVEQTPAAGEASFAVDAATAGGQPADGITPAAGEHPRLALLFEEPVERTAAGQLACLYDGDLLIGYGTIAAAPARR